MVNSVDLFPFDLTFAISDERCTVVSGSFISSNI